MAHITLGYVTGGVVHIIEGNQEYLYHAGDCFYIMPDIPHAIESVNGISYSMFSVCIPVDEKAQMPETKTGYIKQLKQIIFNKPEEVFFIEDMARSINVSPYHMIRQFKAACGLTPHQFQIQCRVRKAQKLLEEGESVTEAAYATGFCDQSHFDRCFRKIVRLTPSAYKRSVRRLP